jgi:hypothetical protein
MGESAGVRSIDAIKEFREVLCRFGDDSKNALGAVDMEIRRALDWLEHEQPFHWQKEIKRRNLEMSDARTALHRKNLSAASGYVPDVSVEKEAIRVAKHRLEEAEQKLQKTRRWVPVLQHAIAEYQGQARPLGDMLGVDLERALALLDRMVMALEGYVSTAPPSAYRRNSSGPSSSMANADGEAPPEGPEPETPEAAEDAESSEPTPGPDGPPAP